MLSAGCKYGIRSALYLVGAGGEKFVPAHTISEALGIPRHFLAKVVQQLTRRDIFRSLRGCEGGIALARPPDQITLTEIVRAFDEELPKHCCLIGLPPCDDAGSCLLDTEWLCTRRAVDETFKDATLAEVARRLRDVGVCLIRGGAASETM